LGCVVEVLSGSIEELVGGVESRNSGSNMYTGRGEKEGLFLVGGLELGVLGGEEGVATLEVGDAGIWGGRIRLGWRPCCLMGR
jgi:hypothetical protein